MLAKNHAASISPVSAPVGGHGSSSRGLHSQVGHVLHARIHSADEATRTFHADLDEPGGLMYDKSKRHFKNPPLRFHAPTGDGGKGKEAGEVKSADMDDSRKKIRFKMVCADDAEWQKIASRTYTHVRFLTKPGSGGGQVPTHAMLSDSIEATPVKFMRLQKRDGSVAQVAIPPRFDNAVGPLAKSDGSLNPFKAIFRAGPKIGRF